MPIHPLPQFEADIEADRKADLARRLRDVGVPDGQAEKLSELPEDDVRIYKKLATPKTIVVRYGVMKMVGEFPYRGSEKPGCGSKMVVQTHRGLEVGEMLTSTCPNSGCSKSVSRQEMLEYIDNSGGRQYPFRTDGKVLRVATMEDLDAQSKLEQSRHALRTEAKRRVEAERIPVKIVDAEPILGDERLTIYYTTEEQVDPHRMSDIMRGLHPRRVDVRQVGARDEARISADYEKCGQYCCCKNFLKVLKPVSMKSAKIQKATLDPLKISGRCGRLMCCLRYEDETYDQLRKKLPNKKKRVGTPEGDGIVMDTQILTQLALVKLDSGTDVAIPVEELTEPEHERAPERPEPRMRSERGRHDRGAGRGPARERPDRERPDRERPDRKRRDEPAGPADTATEDKPKRKRKRRKKPSEGADAATSAASPVAPADTPTEPPSDGATDAESTIETGEPVKKKNRRRRKRRTPEGEGSTSAETLETASSSEGADVPTAPGEGDASSGGESGAPKKKRRRRRRRRKPDSGDPNAGAPDTPSDES
ncbi:MAG: regulatory iron-sulfur-containing complex subunit RicT [Planctomycetota bacterium]